MFELLIVGGFVIAIVWISCHYTYIGKKQRSLTPGDEHMIEDVWKSAREMERRIQALEEILDIQARRNADGEPRPADPHDFPQRPDASGRMM